jgi:hypothetical protein
VEIFFNDQKAVAHDYPGLGAKPIGGSLTLFIEIALLKLKWRALKRS